MIQTRHWLSHVDCGFCFERRCNAPLLPAAHLFIRRQRSLVVVCCSHNRSGRSLDDLSKQPKATYDSRATWSGPRKSQQFAEKPVFLSLASCATSWRPSRGTRRLLLLLLRQLPSVKPNQDEKSGSEDTIHNKSNCIRRISYVPGDIVTI